jgi:hypothetical protein
LKMLIAVLFVHIDHVMRLLIPCNTALHWKCIKSLEEAGRLDANNTMMLACLHSSSFKSEGLQQGEVEHSALKL